MYHTLQSDQYKGKDARAKHIKALLRQLFGTEGDIFTIPYSNNSGAILSDEVAEEVAVAFDRVLDNYYSNRTLNITPELNRIFDSSEHREKKFIQDKIKEAIMKIKKPVDRTVESIIDTSEHTSDNDQIVVKNNPGQAIISNNTNQLSSNNQVIARNNQEQTITTKQNNELPLIFDYRPEFHPPNDSSIVQQLSLFYTGINVYHEVNAVAWLRLILKLDAEAVGLPDNVPLLLAKFKATMILQAYELFQEREAWNRKFTAHLSSLFKDIRSELLSNAINGNSREVGLANAKITASLVICSHFFLPIDTGLSNIEEMVREAFHEIKNGRIIGPTISETIVLWETHIQEVFDKLTRNLYAETFKISIEQQSDAFNFKKLEKLLEDEKFSKPLQGRAGFWSGNQIQQMQKIIDLRAEYTSFYKKFLSSCKDTEHHAGRIASNFNDKADRYSECYLKAFDSLKKNPKRYVDDFLLEMVLQQDRKSNHAPLLYEQLEKIFLPVANKSFYRKKQLPEKTIVDITIELKTLALPPPSLEELVAGAYAILHTPLNSLNNALKNNASLFIGWVDLPSNTNSNNANALAIIPNNTRALVNTLEPSTPPLFDPNSPIPGAITSAQVSILADRFDHISKYKPLFSGISSSKNIINATDLADRYLAVNIFDKALAEANTIEEIMALLIVAKPYINRHRNPLTDWMRNKENTETWKTCFKAARVRALSLLPTAAPTETLLNAYRSEFIFADHRKESYLLGAWGNTSAQRDIDSMIGNLKK